MGGFVLFVFLLLLFFFSVFFFFSLQPYQFRVQAFKQGVLKLQENNVCFSCDCKFISSYLDISVSAELYLKFDRCWCLCVYIYMCVYI